MRKHQGASTLLITFVLFLAAVLIIIFATNYSMLQQKTSTNQYSNNQAFEAAEAGLEFGLAYLATNASTIVASASGGNINYGASVSSLTNVSLANGSKFSVVSTNPTTSNYTLLKVTATGISADGTSTHVVVQEAYAPPSESVYSAMSAGAVALIGGSTLTNTIAGVDYSSTLSGQTGKTFWITHSQVSLGHCVTIGSPANPVTLIVEGDLTIANGVTFYGFVYTSSPDGLTLQGGAVIYGGVASAGPINMSNAFKLTYVKVPLIAGGSSGAYSKVTGSWRDF